VAGNSLANSSILTSNAKIVIPKTVSERPRLAMMVSEPATSISLPTMIPASETNRRPNDFHLLSSSASSRVSATSPVGLISSPLLLNLRRSRMDRTNPKSKTAPSMRES
jgi:hypothetical protein